MAVKKVNDELIFVIKVNMKILKNILTKWLSYVKFKVRLKSFIFFTKPLENDFPSFIYENHLL